MADPTPPTRDPAPEDLPSGEMYDDAPLYSGRQTALVLGAMGLGFLVLLVLLFWVMS